MGGRYDGWHLYGPEGPRQYTASVLNILNKAGVVLTSFSPASSVSEVDEKGNAESSHETVSSGEVQGGLGRGLPVMPPSDASGTLSSSTVPVNPRYFFGITCVRIV